MSVEPKIIDEQFDEQKTDKKEWEAMMMEAHPEILKLAEETRTIQGLKENASDPNCVDYAFPSYSRTVSDQRIFNPDALTEEELIMLICDYLEKEKLPESRDALLKEVMEQHPEYTLLPKGASSSSRSFCDPSLVDSFAQLVRMGLPDSDNLFQKLPFEEKDFAILPNEKYDDRIEFASKEGDQYANTKITQERIEPNVNCEIIMEKEVKCKKESQYYEIPVVMTVNQLVLFLFDNQPMYTTKFFAVYRDFLSPGDLLTKMIDYKTVERISEEDQAEVSKKFGELMTLWSSKYPQDFTPQMIATVKETPFNEQKDVLSKIDTVKTNFDKFNIILKDNETFRKYFPHINTTNYPQSLPDEIFSNKLYLKDIKPSQLADTLFTIHNQFYRAITDDELARASGPNVDLVLKMFNVEIEWIKQSLFGERILPDGEGQKLTMQKVKEYFMDVWIESGKLNDFHACAVFVTVFNSNDDKKEFLKRNVSQQKEALILLNLFKSLSQYSNYKNKVFECLGINNGTPVSFIPFIAFVLHDIITIRTGLDGFTEDGRVNFLKYNAIFNALDEFNLFRKVESTFVPIYQLISLILRGMADVEHLVSHK